MQDSADPTRNLNANTFDFNFATGWDVAIEREMGRDTLEARYLSIDGWDSATTAIVGAPTLVQINTSPPSFLPGITSVNATYNSELTNGELNWRRCVSDCVSLLAGFRYIELDEHFHADASAAVFPATYDTVVQNRLYGGQLGLDATLWERDRLTIEGLAKLGVFGNSSNQSTAFGNGLFVATAADNNDRTAFLGELSFTTNYCLTDHLNLRAGYDLLWLETVTLASDQIPATNFGPGAGIAPDGGVFYHGAFVGLEYRH